MLDAQWLQKSGRFVRDWNLPAIERIAREMAAADIAILQLRCKRPGREACQFIQAWIRPLRQWCPDTAIIINDRVDLALYFEADGVHVGQEDVPPHLCRRLLGPERIIGLSTHTPEEIRQAAETPVDYIGFGPIYPTTSKTDTHATQGIESLKEACQISTLPLVAIGGIGLDQLPDIAPHADAAAMIGGLWTTDHDATPFQAATRCWALHRQSISEGEKER